MNISVSFVLARLRPVLVGAGVTLVAIVALVAQALPASASMSGTWTGDICGPAYAGMWHTDHTCAQFLRVKHADGTCTVTAIRIKAEPVPVTATSNSGARPYVTEDYSNNPALSFASLVLMSASGKSIQYYHGGDSMGKHPSGLIIRTYDIPDRRVSALRLNLNGARAHLGFLYRDVTQNLVLRRAC
jgi:hypothetical protein